MDKQVSIAITGVWNPSKQLVEQFELYGQPFGAAHAVPNFYRVAEYASVLLTRAYKLLIDHFFDDYFYVEREASAKTTMFCVQQSFSSGFVWIQTSHSLRQKCLTYWECNSTPQHWLENVFSMWSRSPHAKPIFPSWYVTSWTNRFCLPQWPPA